MTQRDQFWSGMPAPVEAWAALKRDGSLMPNSVRERAEDVIRACGDCVPVKVLITCVLDDDPRDIYYRCSGCGRKSISFDKPFPELCAECRVVYLMKFLQVAKLDDDGETVSFSSGRIARTHRGIIGLSPDLWVTHGYDGSIKYNPQEDQWDDDLDDLTDADMRELADLMIARWTRFKTGLKP